MRRRRRVSRPPTRYARRTSKGGSAPKRRLRSNCQWEAPEFLACKTSAEVRNVPWPERGGAEGEGLSGAAASVRPDAAARTCAESVNRSAARVPAVRDVPGAHQIPALLAPAALRHADRARCVALAGRSSRPALAHRGGRALRLCFPCPSFCGEGGEGESLVTPSPSRAREGLLPRRGGAAALARRTLDAGDGGMAPTGRRGASAALQNIPPTLAAKRARRRPACSRGKEGGRLARHPRWQPGRAQPPVAGVSWAPSRFWSPPPPQAPCMPARSYAGGPPAVGSRCSEVWRTTVGGA